MSENGAALRVRRLVPGDEAVLGKIRIAALTDSPFEFGSTLERESAYTAADWHRWITTSAVFVADGASGPCGLVAGAASRIDPSIAYLLAMWVRPESRGSSAADALIGAVVEWAREGSFTAVVLDVVRDNRRAQRVYERNGFALAGREKIRERDGAIELEMRRALR